MNEQSFTEKTATFTANGERCSVTARLHIDPTPGRDIDLNPVQAKQTLSITGECAGSAGQCIDSIREAGEGIPEIERLCDIWVRWHLNGMVCGTRAQRDYLASLPSPEPEFEARKRLLASAGLHPAPYAYGSAWLYEPIPAEVLDELDALITRLDGADLGEAPDLDGLPGVDEDADTIDSRDVIARCDGLRLAVQARGYDPDNLPDEGEIEESLFDLAEEYRELKALCAEGEGYAPDWNYGETLIHEDYFTEYAQGLAEDLDAINRDGTWPNNHIDWDAAAEELKMDYTAIEFRGVTFWVR